MEFLGVMNKQPVEFPGVNQKRIGISRGKQEKVSRSLNFALGTSQECNTINFLEFSGVNLFLSRISGCKVRSLQIQGLFSKKYALNSPLVCFSPGITHLINCSKFGGPIQKVKVVLFEVFHKNLPLKQMFEIFFKILSFVLSKIKLQGRLFS